MRSSTTAREPHDRKVPFPDKWPLAQLLTSGLSTFPELDSSYGDYAFIETNVLADRQDAEGELLPDAHPLF